MDILVLSRVVGLSTCGEDNRLQTQTRKYFCTSHLSLNGVKDIKIYTCIQKRARLIYGGRVLRPVVMMVCMVHHHTRWPVVMMVLVHGFLPLAASSQECLTRDIIHHVCPVTGFSYWSCLEALSRTGGCPYSWWCIRGEAQGISLPRMSQVTSTRLAGSGSPRVLTNG